MAEYLRRNGRNMQTIAEFESTMTDSKPKTTDIYRIPEESKRFLQICECIHSILE